MSLKLDIQSAIRSVTKDWKQAKRKADRADRVSNSALERMRYRPARVTVRDVAFEVMEAAYNKASSNGRYYANARQIMYAARPEILERTGEQLESAYFTQTLLKDYLEEFTPSWKVVWDARGHLIEPYTNKVLGIGGSEVAGYTKEWTKAHFEERPGIKMKERIQTIGPISRFNNVLFVEKEGFTEILRDAEIPERYSMALMSTKGVPVGAACDLIAALKEKNVNVFVLHDFDLAGFKILRTLRTGTRLSVGSDVIDLGLRMADIDDLDYEDVIYKQEIDPRYYLEECGATPEERAFLVNSEHYGGYGGKRVEINAMTSEQLLNWLDKKFAEHGVKKLIPDADAIAAAYKRAVYLQRVEERIREVESEIRDKGIDMPKGLVRKLDKAMEKQDSKSWDEIVWELAKRRTEK